MTIRGFFAPDSFHFSSFAYIFLFIAFLPVSSADLQVQMDAGRPTRAAAMLSTLPAQAPLSIMINKYAITKQTVKQS
jgi:hypothetical protein